MKLRALALVGSLAVTLVSACAAPDETPADGPKTSGASASVSAVAKDDEIAAMLPADIKKAGTVRVASGVSFPPMEYFAEDNKTVLGFDADLGKALGEVLGVTFDFQNTNFDGIIGGLEAGRYDLALTSMNDKKERQATVTFIDYLSSGITFMVPEGNPKNVQEKLDLCGLSAAVEKSTAGDFTVDAVNDECAAEGEKPVNKLPFPDQTSAVQALQSGRADAVVTLDLSLAYVVKENPGAFELAIEPFDTMPVGIVVPKGSTELRDAVQAALKKLQETGVYDELLAKWSLEDQALLGAPLNQGK